MELYISYIKFDVLYLFEEFLCGILMSLLNVLTAISGSALTQIYVLETRVLLYLYSAILRFIN